MHNETITLAIKQINIGSKSQVREKNNAFLHAILDYYEDSSINFANHFKTQIKKFIFEDKKVKDQVHSYYMNMLEIDESRLGSKRSRPVYIAEWFKAAVEAGSFFDSITRLCEQAQLWKKDKDAILARIEFFRALTPQCQMEYSENLIDLNPEEQDNLPYILTDEDFRQILAGNDFTRNTSISPSSPSVVTSPHRVFSSSNTVVTTNKYTLAIKQLVRPQYTSRVMNHVFLNAILEYSQDCTKKILYVLQQQIEKSKEQKKISISLSAVNDYLTSKVNINLNESPLDYKRPKCDGIQQWITAELAAGSFFDSITGLCEQAQLDEADKAEILNKIEELRGKAPQSQEKYSEKSTDSLSGATSSSPTFSSSGVGTSKYSLFDSAASSPNTSTKRLASDASSLNRPNKEQKITATQMLSAQPHPIALTYFWDTSSNLGQESVEETDGQLKVYLESCKKFLSN